MDPYSVQLLPLPDELAKNVHESLISCVPVLLSSFLGRVQSGLEWLSGRHLGTARLSGDHSPDGNRSMKVDANTRFQNVRGNSDSPYRWMARRFIGG